MFAREHEGTCQVPEIVKEIAAGRDATAVWRNEVGGVTCRLGDADEREREFLKWTPRGNGVDLSAEVDRLAWAVRYTTVPRVVSQGADEQGTWFLSAALPGTSAVEDRWHEEHRHIDSVERALDMLADIPPVDELVVCHGDTCAPNTLIGEDGNCSGHVDLDLLGVADRWADPLLPPPVGVVRLADVRQSNRRPIRRLIRGLIRGPVPALERAGITVASTL